MGSRIEHDVPIVCEGFLDDDFLSIEWAQGWHRSDLAVGVQALELVLACEPKRARMCGILQSRDIHLERRGQHREKGTIVSDADHDLGPVMPWNLRGRCLLLCRVRDRMPEHRIPRMVSVEKL